MFLSRGDRDLGVAFQTHPGRQAFISSGSKEARSALAHAREMESKCKGPEAGRSSANLATDREEGKNPYSSGMIKDRHGPRWQVGLGWG